MPRATVLVALGYSNVAMSISTWPAHAAEGEVAVPKNEKRPPADRE
jgi:hypothetical protein